MLEQYLEQKPVFYRRMNIFRFFALVDKLQGLLPVIKTVHILGTNAKGSTGRYLAQMLGKKYNTAHYSSPHILSFKERFWANFDYDLELAHQELQTLLKSRNLVDNLSYFEYLTLLAPFVFKKANYLILEAGMGGEFDATSAFSKDLCIFTPIDLDHEDMLGSSIESIARTKLKAMTDINISSMQKDIVKTMAEKIARLKGSKFIFADLNDYENCLDEALFLKQNFAVAKRAYLELEKSEFRADLKLDLNGRCRKIRNNLIIDVGHNELAAKALIKELEKYNTKFSLICNFFADKNVFNILKTLKPYLAEIIPFNYDSNRALIDLKPLACELNIKISSLEKFSSNEDYFLDSNKNYLVFGSFLLVEHFLRSFDFASEFV